MAFRDLGYGVALFTMRKGYRVALLTGPQTCLPGLCVCFFFVD